MGTETCDVVLRGVHHSVTEETLKDLFSNSGDVLKCVLLQRNPKFETVMAFIGYETKVECEAAVSTFNNFKLKGERLSVQIADKKGHSKNASGAHSPNKPDQNAKRKVLGMGRGGSPPVRSNGPATFIPPQPPRPSLLKTPPSHMRLSATKTPEEDRAFGNIKPISENTMSSRRPRISEPPASNLNNLRSRIAAARKSESGGTPSPAAPSVQPPSRSLKKGDRAKFFVELSMLEDLTSDLTCQSDDPMVFTELHELYSNKKGQNAFSAPEPPAVSSYVAAPYEKIYFRAHVLSVEAGGVVNVLFIDYGNKESINLRENHVYPLEDRFVELKPALFVKCRLDGSDRNQEIFQDKISKIDPANPQLTLDAEIIDYNDDTKLCIINLTTDDKKPTNGHVDFDLDNLINFSKYLNKETICLPREVPAPDLIIFVPKYLTNKVEKFDELVNTCKTFDTSSRKFEVGELVCAPFQEALFRAIIKKIEGDMAEVYFIDYGNKATIAFSELKRFLHGCPTEIHTEQAYAVPCKIAGIKPRDEVYSEECVAEMYHHLSQSEIFIQGVGTTYDPTFDGTVLLINMSSDDVPSFADHLIEKKYATRVKTNVTKSPKSATQGAKSSKGQQVAVEVEPLMKVRQKVPVLADLGVNKFSQRSTNWVSISIVNYQSLLYFNGVAESEKGKLDSLSESLMEVYSKKSATFPHADLKIGALVVANSSECGGFYRGSIIRFTVMKGKVEVFYLDFGNTEILSLDQIFPIEEQFLQDSPFAICCSLMDLTEEDCGKGVEEEALLILGKAESKITMRVEKSLVNENPAISAKAIVDIRVAEGNFGSKRLLSMLGIVASAPSTPQKPTSAQNSTTLVKPSPSGEAVSNSDSSHAKLEARIKQLEDKQVEANNKIFELERLIYSLYDMTATSLDEKENA